MKATWLTVVFGLTMVLAIAPAIAKDKDKGKHGAAHAEEQGHGNHFGDRDRAVIHDYYVDAGRGGHCPPGLAKKNNGCLPPGQAKKLYNVGQRYNRNFGNLWSYNQIPYDLRDRYDFDQSDRYYYNNGYIYQVDPRTMLIQQVVSALLR